MRKTCGLFFLVFLVLLVDEVIANDLENLLGNEELSSEYKLACGSYVKHCKKYGWWITLEAWFLDFNAMTSCQFSGEEWDADMKLLYPKAHLDFSETKIEFGVIPRKRSLEFSFSTLFDVKRINWWRDLNSNFFIEENLNTEFSFFIKEERPL